MAAMSKDNRRGLSPRLVKCTECRAMIGSNVLDNHNGLCPFCGYKVRKESK